jgi:hypothetical protein
MLTRYDVKHTVTQTLVRQILWITGSTEDNNDKNAQCGYVFNLNKFILVQLCRKL